MILEVSRNRFSIPITYHYRVAIFILIPISVEFPWEKWETGIPVPDAYLYIWNSGA